jgi:hypothetical protein
MSKNKKPVLRGNLERAFSPHCEYKDLLDKNFEQVVIAFKDRIKAWYIDQALFPIQKSEGFLMTTMSCIVIDLLSQYYYNLDASRREEFEKFLSEHIPEFNEKIEPLESSTFYSDEWSPETIANLSHAFYHGFRCGIVHNGRVLEYGRISGDLEAPKIVQVKPWKNGGGREVAVNPRLLIERVDKIFHDYVDKLLDPSNKDLREKFAKKFERDFAIPVKL